MINKLSLFGLLLLPLFCAAQEKAPPNIIFILTDDQRWDALGFAGNEIIRTPHQDELARAGVYFKNAFVTTPICAASRASILTGLYERTHDFTFRTPPLAASYVDISYPKLLKDNGYQLGFFGKLGMTLENRMDTVLFDEQYVTGTNGYFRLTGEGWSRHIHLTDHTTDKALDFIKSADRDRPFCVSISYNAPHADDTSPQQYFWPQRHDGLYREDTVPGPALGAAKYFEALPEFLQDSMTIGRIRWKWRYETPEKYQEMVKGYYRMISTIDDNLGRLRTRLEEWGLANNTIIIFTGDNGYFLGERRLAGKWLMYDNSLRVPLIVYDPRNAKPAVVDNLVLNIDIAPTILDFAGAAVPDAMQGSSLRPLTLGNAKEWRQEFVCEHLYELPYIPKSEGIRGQRWKYFRYLDHPDSEELYDLESDPMEINNLASEASYRDLLLEYRKKLDAKIQQLEKASFPD